MNETPSFSEISPPPVPPSTQQPATQSIPPQSAPIDAFASAQGRAPHMPRIPSHRLTYAALAALLLLAAAQWWNTSNELASLRTEMARRMQSDDTAVNETKGIVKSVQETTKEVQAKVNVLEGKQAESQSQQLALAQLYQDLSKNRDDWALAEIEQVLSTASQQLQLAGNVQGALIALQNADSRLSRSDKPQFILIRRSLAHDIEKLRALPNLDLTGIALRLDSVIGQIDTMPLLSDEKPVVTASQPKNSRRSVPRVGGTVSAASKDGAPAVAAKEGMLSEWWGAVEDKWHSWGNEMWTEVSQLIRVRNVESSDALLLSPTQAYYARENLKLRLLNARLALLSRNESAFRSDMIGAQDSIVKYFDTRAKQTQTTQGLLKQIQGSNLSIDLPSLSESINAVRNYKAVP
jgi:uroporphyrin-III C-methyltransferase